MTKPLSVALSIWLFKPGTGGMQAHALQLAKALKRRGHQVSVHTRFYTQVPGGVEYLQLNESRTSDSIEGIPVVPLHTRLFGLLVQKALATSVERRITARAAIAYYCRRAVAQTPNPFLKADLVHHIGQSHALFGFLAERLAKASGKPFVIQPTCHPQQYGDNFRDHMLFGKAKRMLVHTAFEQRYLAQLFPHIPSTIVGNGIEDRRDGQAERFYAKTGIKGPFILFLGRKDPDKGYNLTLDAFSRLRTALPHLSLVCIGPNGDNKSIEPRPDVHELSYVDEDLKHDALAACACLCVPSEGESFGLVFMEAGRYKKPVIAKRLPVLDELLQEGQAGLLLGTQDVPRNCVTLSADELAQGIRSLLSAPAMQETLGSCLFRVSENFVWDKVVQRFEGAYEEALRP